MSHPHCVPGGYDDINLDLSLGTGLSVRVKNDLNVGVGGTLGARLQLQIMDIDGTNAVVTTWVVGKPWIKRPQPVLDDWTTYKFFFKALDYAWDNGSSALGTVPGLNLNHVRSIRFLWRRETASGTNAFRFDEVKLIDDPVVPWGDANQDGDIDLADFATLQRCFGTSPVQCPRFDADYDGDVDYNDFQTWRDGYLGSDVTEGFFPWCY